MKEYRLLCDCDPSRQTLLQRKKSPAVLYTPTTPRGLSPEDLTGKALQSVRRQKGPASGVVSHQRGIRTGVGPGRYRFVFLVARVCGCMTPTCCRQKVLMRGMQPPPYYIRACIRENRQKIVDQIDGSQSVQPVLYKTYNARHPVPIDI